MKAFQWFLMVAAASVVGLADCTARAEGTNQVGSATAENSSTVTVNPATGASAAPAVAVASPAQDARCGGSCGTTCNTCCGTSGNACCGTSGEASCCTSGNKCCGTSGNACCGTTGETCCGDSGNACSDSPKWYAFGEYLLLRPRNEGVEYAVPINGPIEAGAVPLQVGPTAVTDPQFQSGFRLGVAGALGQCASVSLTYTYYRNEVDDGPVSADSPYVLRPMVINPSSADAASDFSMASASEIITFNLVDLDYHHSLWSGDCGTLNYLVGTRYAELNQNFQADFGQIITAAVGTNIEFNGAGLRFGLDGERTIAGGFFMTASATTNFLGGQFSGSYLQSNANNPVEATTSWQEARFVTILEAGAAVGWQSQNGRIRTTVGYMVSDWLNVVKPSDFISAVQANQYVGTNQIGNTSLIFDGLTARFEFGW